MKWIWKIIIIAIVLFVLYFYLRVYIGPPAIRPTQNQVQDSLLLPFLEDHANNLDAKKGDPNLRLALGMSYEAAELYLLAEKTYQQFVDQHPNEVIGWYRLAVVQERQGDLRKGIYSLQRASKLSPPDMAAPFWQLALWSLDVGDIEQAEIAVTKASTIDPKSPPLQVAKVRLALENDNPDEAVKILIEGDAMSKIPNNYGWQLLGRAYRAQGDEERSKVAWSRAGQVRPRWGDPWTGDVRQYLAGLREMKQRIGVLANAGKLDQTQQLIQKFYQYDTTDVVINRVDAMCDLQKGNVRVAVKKLKKITAENPGDTFSKLVYAQARFRHPLLRTDVELQATQALVQEVLKVQSTDSRAHLLLGNIYASRVLYEDAINSYRTCIGLDPSNKQAMNAILIAIGTTKAWAEHKDIILFIRDKMPNHPVFSKPEPVE